MIESSFQEPRRTKPFPDPLVAELQRFTDSLIEQGYADVTVRVKVKLVTSFGQWLKRNRLAVTDLAEPLVETFLERKHRVHRGDLRTLQQFLDHLRRHHVVPARNLACDRSLLADILNRYETHLRTERGLVPVTIRGYLPFVHTFLLERFRGRPFLLKAVKASDISDFVLRHSHSMGIKTAQLMTT